MTLRAWSMLYLPCSSWPIEYCSTSRFRCSSHNCKCFGLCGGDEHWNLEVEQYSIGQDEHGRYLRFVGRSSKNYHGGLQHRRVQNKDLRIYSKPEMGNRCVVDLFSEYLSLVPPNGPFYRRPIKNSRPPKFSKQCLGRNTLSTIVKRFCEKAELTGNYTNHSSKVTCAILACFVVELMSNWSKNRLAIVVIQFELTRDHPQSKMQWCPKFCNLQNLKNHSCRKKTSLLWSLSRAPLFLVIWSCQPSRLPRNIHQFNCHLVME